MLKIVIPDQPKEQFWDEVNECFVYKDAVKGCELILEHSLLSVSKWESIWCKPFLSEDEKTVAEVLSYVECMTVSPSRVDPEIYKRISQSEIDKVNEYIKHPATATTFGGNGHGIGHSGEIVTSELVYYWMVALQIPFECQKWHFNRLLTLVKICEIKNNPDSQKKRSAAQMRRDYDKLNDLRRKQLHTKG